MNNTELFDDGPRLLRCDGCGRYFEEPLLKRCRACGKLFCAECRTTHDCREPVSEQPAASSVPPVIIRGLDENLGSTEWERETPQEPAPQRKYTPLTFIDDEKNSIGSADVRRKEEPKPFGSYEIPVPEASAVRTAAAEQPVYQTPYASPYDTSLNRQSPYQNSSVPPYTSPSKQQAPAAEYVPAYDIPAAETTPACGPDELICDDCGKVWKKSDLRKCKKCGAVLCPNCREKHKCKKNDKKSSAKKSSHAAPAEAKYANLYPQAQQNAEPNLAVDMPEKKKKVRKEKHSKNTGDTKSHGKLILAIILSVILLAAVAVAVLMMQGIIQPLNL